MRITWDQVGTRKYEVGVDHGVFYKNIGGEFTDGIPWNGLTNVEVENNGGESEPLYIGDVKVDVLHGNDDVTGTIYAFTYPDEFELCIGSMQIIPGIFIQNQAKDLFGLSYRTFIGNDIDGQEDGYKLHLIYSIGIEETSRSNRTINDSMDDMEMSWGFSTIPNVTEDYDPFSELIIDSTKFDPESMQVLEDILYGTEEEPARLPTLDELIDLFYVEEPPPPEWEGYPHDRTYPATDRYPYDPTSHNSFTVRFEPCEIPSGESETWGLGNTEPFIPEGSTVVRYVVSNIPLEFLDLEWTATMTGDDYTMISVTATNNTSETVTIESRISVKVTIYYIPSEEGEEESDD